MSITSRNIDRLSKILSLLDSAQNLLQIDHYVSCHTLKTLLHYLKDFKTTCLNIREASVTDWDRFTDWTWQCCFREVATKTKTSLQQHTDDILFTEWTCAMMLKPAVDTSAVELMDTRQAADSLTQTHGAPEKNHNTKTISISQQQNLAQQFLSRLLGGNALCCHIGLHFLQNYRLNWDTSMYFLTTLSTAYFSQHNRSVCITGWARLGAAPTKETRLRTELFASY